MVLVQRGESTVGFDPGKLSGLRVGSVPHEAHRRDRALSLAMIRRLALSRDGKDADHKAGGPRYSLKIAYKILLGLSRRCVTRPWRGRTCFLVDKGLRQRAITPEQVSLNLDRLIGQRIDLRRKGLVTGKRNLDLMRPWRNEHPSAHTIKLRHVSHEKAIHKNCGTRRFDRDLDRGHHRRDWPPRGLFHRYINTHCLLGLDLHLLGEVLVAILAHGNQVFTGQQQKLLRSLELFKVAYVLAVHPDAGSLFNSGFSCQSDLSHHIISSRIYGGG